MKVYKKLYEHNKKKLSKAIEDFKKSKYTCDKSNNIIQYAKTFYILKEIIDKSLSN